jgi:hypothetical protein
MILYRCGNQTQWNSRFDTPLTPDTPGLFEGVADISLTGYCIAVRPRHDPSLWYMPYLDSWTVEQVGALTSVTTTTASRRNASRTHSHAALLGAHPPPRQAPVRGKASTSKHAAGGGGAATAAVAATLSVVVNDTAPMRKFNGLTFLAVNIDTGSLFNALDMNDPVLVNLMYAMAMNSGGVMRIGT